MNKKQLIVIFIILMCMFLNGCAVLRLPFQIVGGTLNILGKVVRGAVKLIKRSPKPPPAPEHSNFLDRTVPKHEIENPSQRDAGGIR